MMLGKLYTSEDRSSCLWTEVRCGGEESLCDAELLISAWLRPGLPEGGMFAVMSYGEEPQRMMNASSSQRRSQSQRRAYPNYDRQ
jgi:hypothetical protein